jgi:pimeloyl-ACP methyl ester carboxylesterase
MSAPFESAQAAMLARWGVAAQSRFVDVPGGRAHVLVAGDGPPVVLLNGGGTPAAMWAPLIAQLDGVTAYAVDLPGFGLSELDPAALRSLRTEMPRFLAATLDALALPGAVFVANSFGGLCTIWLALDEPHRVPAVALVGCPALAPGTAAPLPMRLLSTRGVGTALGRLQPPSPRQVHGLAKMVREHPLPPELVDLLVATERLPGFEAWFRPLLRRLVRLRGPRPELALTADQLAGIRQPVVVVWGQDDPFGTPADGQHLARCIPRAELHVVPGGHVPWVHHPELVGRLVGQVLSRRRSTAG